MTAAVEERIRRYRAEMIVQGLLFPAVYQAYREYTRRPAGARALLALQRERLVALLQHAARSVPVYRHLAAGVAAAADPWRALALFPPVTKDDIRPRLADFCDDDLDPARCRAAVTSGTSGEPFRIVHDVGHLVHGHALALRRNELYGLGFDRKILHPFHSWLDRWFEYTAPAQGYARIAMFGRDGDEAYWSDVVARIRGYRPDVLVGHPSCCLELAGLLGPARPAELRPAVVVTWGERLTAGERARLEEYFAAPVRDQYGMREVGTIAAQCLAGTYHVEAERLWLEVVDAAGAPVPDGEPGELVVTNLLSRAMPLIRYRTGDTGTLSAGRCGCPVAGKAMDLVEGRRPGRLRFPGGGGMDAARVVRVAEAFPVQRFQVVQVDVDHLEVVLRPEPAFTDADAGRLRERVEGLVGGRLRVRVRTDGQFRATVERKVTDFVSLLPADGPSGAGDGSGDGAG